MRAADVGANTLLAALVRVDFPSGIISLYILYDSASITRSKLLRYSLRAIFPCKFFHVFLSREIRSCKNIITRHRYNNLHNVHAIYVGIFLYFIFLYILLIFLYNIPKTILNILFYIINKKKNISILKVTP